MIHISKYRTHSPQFDLLDDLHNVGRIQRRTSSTAAVSPATLMNAVLVGGGDKRGDPVHDCHGPVQLFTIDLVSKLKTFFA